MLLEDSIGGGGSCQLSEFCESDDAHQTRHYTPADTKGNRRGGTAVVEEWFFVIRRNPRHSSPSPMTFLHYYSFLSKAATNRLVLSEN